MEHKHSGTDGYANNSGHVDPAASPLPEKDDHAKDSSVPRRAVTPAPAVPVDGKGRALGHPLYGL